MDGANMHVIFFRKSLPPVFNVPGDQEQNINILI